MTLFDSLLPIVLALAAGSIAGRLMPGTINVRLIKLIAPLVWFLPFLIGAKFGAVMCSRQQVSLRRRRHCYCSP